MLQSDTRWIFWMGWKFQLLASDSPEVASMGLKWCNTLSPLASLLAGRVRCSVALGLVLKCFSHSCHVSNPKNSP